MSDKDKRPNQQSATDYRCSITLPNRTISINASSEEQIKADLESILQTKPTFQQHGNSTWVYHQHFMEGNEPIGVILKQELPEAFSVQRVVAERMKASAGA